MTPLSIARYDSIYSGTARFPARILGHNVIYHHYTNSRTNDDNHDAVSPLCIPQRAFEADSTRSATSSTDPASLGGAIGGGVGALLLVIIFIWYMMRRITRKEAREIREAPRPWVVVPSTPARSQPPPPSSSEGSRRAPSSYTRAPRGDRKTPIVVNPPRSVVNPLRSVVNPLRGVVNPPRSPVDSTISVPTEFYPLSPQYQPTAVASSQIGTVPLPDVPPSPRDTIHDSQTNLSQMTPSTSAALGLHSHSGSQRSGRDVRQSDASLLRPLPLRPGTNHVGTFTYPPEKQRLPDSERPITKS